MVEILLYINVGLICILILAILIKVPFGTFKKISEMIAKLEVELTSLKNLQERMENILREELRENRNELRNSFFQLREEVRTHLINLTYLNDQKFERLRETVEEKLNFIQEENTKKLDQMREIVEEKLHSTLEKRLSESFKFVSDRLEQVYKSLGEVQALAASVGDLKRVLTNVKTKGIFGEIQLEALLEQILTPEQYVKNFPTKKGSNEKVDFAIKLPGKVDGKNWIYLPIDAKFHHADYQQLLDAYETGDHNVIEESAKKLEMKIKNSAKE
ncbi:MAG: DNA recombination protein RmuC, partial [Candidatus Aenigmatarchaeota archaeon]